MQATKLLSGAASGIGGFVGSMFRVGGGAVDGGVPAAPVLMAAAGGGDIYSGQPTLVGEKGPEMIVPARKGVVIPNNQLGSSMSQPQNVYNGPYIANMSAIDTQSATDFLAKNKMTIWAVNQSANRSIPTSR
jgi:phage-related minor tail protein